jgi:hypothetical protein
LPRIVKVGLVKQTSYRNCRAAYARRFILLSITRRDHPGLGAGAKAYLTSIQGRGIREAAAGSCGCQLLQSASASSLATH